MTGKTGSVSTEDAEQAHHAKGQHSSRLVYIDKQRADG